MSKLLIWTCLSMVSLTLAQAGSNDLLPGDPVIVRFHAARVASDSRRDWINNQLNKASLPPLNDIQVSSLKTGWDTGIFDGFAGQFTPEAARAFAASADVAYVVPDFRTKISDITVQNNAPWGLQRISQPDRIAGGDPSQSTFTYTFDDSAGEGVDIYVLDTGVRISHVDFGGRATFGATFSRGVPGQDIEGHGTHVAGIAAGAVHGVAKSANIIAVKVMDDDGTGATSNIIAGINFVATNVATTNRPSIINLSITTPASQAIDAACAAAVSRGIHVIVAAGNENVDAAQTSPARSESVISVGATDINDNAASFSNFGQTVDIFAPGVSIISLGNEADDAIKTLDGTSMAAPMVSGLVAYLITLQQQNVSPPQMKVSLQNLASKGKILGLRPDTINHLAFNGAGTGFGAPPSEPGPAILQQQGVISSIDNMVSAFSALTATVARRPDDDD
ncbi:subtilisin-like serine protease [Serendipita sp. 407]|nr:subtilisin-like serine protease [Serendipita sp. 407]